MYCLKLDGRQPTLLMNVKWDSAIVTITASTFLYTSKFASRVDHIKFYQKNSFGCFLQKYSGTSMVDSLRNLPNTVQLDFLKLFSMLMLK